MIGRRGFITGLVSVVAAPAIVRAGSLMPVRVVIEAPKLTNLEIINLAFERLAAQRQVWGLANADLMAFGTGAVFVSDDGEFRHVPVGEFY